MHTLLVAEGYEHILIPQSKPLSSGETLGCTAPILPSCDALIFIADGRFHLEAAMIRNPTVAAYRYDPYGKVLTSEAYDVETMKKIRFDAISVAKKAFLKTFSIGNFKHGRFQIGMIDLSSINEGLKAHKFSPIDGVLGSNFLDNFKAVIDYSKKRLTLTK